MTGINSLFKDVMARFPTGVTVITTKFANKQFGLTANSFTSVSLDPPLILFCIAKFSGSYDAFMQTSSFAVNLLTQDQEQIAKHFASKILDKFENISYITSAKNNIILSNSLGYLELKKYATHDAGDHSIIIGEVINGKIDKNAIPLQYLDRNFSSATKFHF